jgi:hypothetical protein
MNKLWLHGALLALLAAGVASVLHLAFSGGWFALAAGLGLALLVALPFYGVRLLDRLLYTQRWLRWRSVEGRHHAFAGLALDIHDDGRHCWLAAADLQRALRRREPEDAVAARHAGRWKRDARGRLQLRVDAVVAALASGPGRMDPHTLHLRRYLEREVLFPAEQRHRRGQGTGGLGGG